MIASYCQGQEDSQDYKQYVLCLGIYETHPEHFHAHSTAFTMM